MAGQDDVVAVVAKQGRAHKSLNAKITKILEFISTRIDIQYIPAVRTASNVDEIVGRLVERALEPTERMQEYQDAVAKIRELQQPILDQLGEAITQTISGFIPGLKSAKLISTNEQRVSAIRSTIDIVVDDGVPTPLRYKGDGVQSLVALAMMRQSSHGVSRSSLDTVIALEEPESHLHPKAIHHLKTVLEGLSSTNQIVITSHNPVFVSRRDVKSNVVVEKNGASPALHIQQIRDILGVRVADNLVSAELVLIVEGSDDAIALRSIIADGSVKIKEALGSGRLGIDAMGGAANLQYKVGLHRTNLCKVYAFMDNDKPGRTAVEKCQKDGLLGVGDYNLAAASGTSDSELEDLFDPTIIQPFLYELGIDLDKSRKTKVTWSERVESACALSGKQLNGKDMARLKERIAEKVAELGMKSIPQHNLGPIECLIENLERCI